jgi:hypothetical protein
LSYAKDFLVWHFARGKRIGDSNNGTSSALRKLFLSYGREWFPDLEYAELLKGGIRDSLARAPQRLGNSKDVFSALQASEIFKAAFEFKTVSREKGILFTFAFVTMLRASQLTHMKTEHWNIVVENNGTIHFEYQVSLKKQRKKFGNMVSRSVSNRHVSHAANAPSLYNPQLGDWASMMKNFIEQQKLLKRTFLFEGLGFNLEKKKPSSILSDNTRAIMLEMGWLPKHSKGEPKRFSGHSTRRSAAVAAFAAGVSKERVAWLGTWSQQDSVDTYLMQGRAQTEHTRHWFGFLSQH